MTIQVSDSIEMAAITISTVSKAFGLVQVLKGVNLSIANGSFFTLLGPSGCGKTTLLRAIAGFIQPDAGKVLFDDRDVTRLPVHKRDIGIVFQDYALFPDKTVSSNVAYGLRARGIEKSTVEREVREHLDRVGLGHLGDRYPAELSGGQRQRAALARALVIKPRVLLMDEPLSNLDAKLRIAMRETIIDLQRASKITTIFVTHDQDEALSMSDQIAIMDRGAIAQIGTPRDLYDEPANPYVADFIGAANILSVRVVRPADAGHVVVALAGQELRCVDGGVTPGNEGKLIVRPEHLFLGEATGGQVSGGQNVVKGCVTRRQYLGARTVYLVSLCEGVTITAEHHASAYRPLLEPGQSVDLVVPMNSRVVTA